MDFQSLKHLSELPESELTAKLIALFGDIQERHNRNKGLMPFGWRDLEAKEDGSFYLANLTETDLDEDVRSRNYSDYAGIIYCICARKKSPESMSWDGGRKIKQAVLREIVLTICGCNNSVEPLIAKLRQPYVDEDTFFSGYTTVDEKEASEHYTKVAKIQMQNRQSDEEYKRSMLTSAPWYKGLGTGLLIMACIGGYKACKRSNEFKSQQNREIIRNLPRPGRQPHVPALNLHKVKLPAITPSSGSQPSNEVGNQQCHAQGGGNRDTLVREQLGTA